MNNIVVTDVHEDLYCAYQLVGLKTAQCQL